ncbi:uncharacterized protein EMH_0064720 [Eimeria mitis]|uniref:Uncharacterized protein n=1 Tax=Eimeria mitis TaxID=44415 RepID=U6KDM3_9EIME|nr:uncharacterized protein EMH_0064720 [Eimeria mitis]CDJ36135.1 hypothetical protein EMH_0064720 [Eimeria mitis]
MERRCRRFAAGGVWLAHRNGGGNTLPLAAAARPGAVACKRGESAPPAFAALPHPNSCSIQTQVHAAAAAAAAAAVAAAAAAAAAAAKAELAAASSSSSSSKKQQQRKATQPTVVLSHPPLLPPK